jgi:hypothetical protein
MRAPALFNGWPPKMVVALGVVIVAGIAIRAFFLPDPGYRADINEFVDAVQRIARLGLGHAYDQPMSFGPVMADIWGLQSALDPAFRAGVGAQDVGLRMFMKLPAVLADFGIAAILVYVFRDRPVRAVVAAAIVLLNPAIWIDSAWWGQFESMYTLALLAAFVLAADKRELAASVFLAVALMTKPQALPMLLPFAAWFLAYGGVWTLLRATAAGGLTVLVLWLPFIQGFGPANYLHSLLYYSNDKFGFVSFGAWNAWWLYIETVSHGVVRDTVAVLGGIQAKYIAYAVTGVVALVIAWAVARLRTVRALAMGLVATALVSFCFLTQMHERYSYAALVFLVLLLPDWRAIGLEIALSVVFVLNLIAAAAIVGNADLHVDLFGPTGLAGSVAMVVISLVALALALAPAVRGMRRDTSASSGAATSAA